MSVMLKRSIVNAGTVSPPVYSYDNFRMFSKIKRWFRRPKNSAGNVYYVRLRTHQGIFYKLGYTTKSTLVDRLAYGGSGDEKLIDHEIFFTFREDAWDVEQTLLEHFDKQRAFRKYSNDPMMPMAGRGQTELFAYDILGLDADLYRQDPDMLGAIKEFEEKSNGGCLMIMIGLILTPFTLGWSLFFVLGGASQIFGAASGSVVKTPARPVHPPVIQKLIDDLNCGAK